MNNFFRSFYVRLSLIFLLLISVIGASCIIIAFYFSGHLFDEVEQLLNREYAQDIALEIQPLLEEGFAVDRIKSAIHYMMVLNPMVEIYILDDSGNILVYFTHPQEKVIKEKIDITPVIQFINNTDKSLILGEDPRSNTRFKPFSAAPLHMGSVDGYVYIILGGQEYDRSLESIISGYYARVALIAFLLTLLITLVAGFLLFFLLTNRLRVLNKAITAFKQGEPFKPLDIGGKDELSSIGKAFNEMAASIKEGVEKLKNAEQMRKELVANISHDLRSPLTSIMGYVETVILKDSELSPEKRKEFLEIILRNLSGFRKLVNELFEFVMLETKQIKPDKEMFNLHELVQDIVLKLKAQADSAKVKLTFKALPHLPMVKADIGMIERAITNLIENGIRFTPPGNSVSVDLFLEGRDIWVSVTDTGKGIDPADLPYIFDRYFHGKKNKDRSSGKTGLGLAIARQIVELHGGSLNVESTLNKGTRFSFNLSAASSGHSAS
jgi:signal transduction histidine kinase